MTKTPVKRNLTKAREIFTKAAAQGNAVAQQELGVMYYKGAGGEHNLTKARELFAKAAAQGNALAQYIT